MQEPSHIARSGVHPAGRSSPELGLVADPRSLGLAAFATTTFLFGMSYTTLWPTAVTGALTLALVFGGAIQVLAGIWAFAKRLTFASTVFCSFGAFYVSYYLLFHSSLTGLHGNDLNIALGSFFLAWLIFSSYAVLASLQVSGVAMAILLFWMVAYLLLVIGYLSNGSTNLFIGAGAAAIASAGCAWYGSAAFLVNETFGSERLPIFSRTG